MNLKTDVEKLEAGKVKLTVEVPYEELKDKIDSTYKEVAQQVNIPGFRKGKVPAPVLDRKVGRAYIIEQAVNNSLSNLYAKALNEADLQPLAQPEVEIIEVPALEGPLGGQLKFTAEVVVVPEFKLADVSKLKVKVDEAEVSDNDVEKELDALRDRFAALKPVERGVKKGDYVSIDMVAKIGDKEIDSVAGISYEAGSASMLDGMDQALYRMKAGASKTFTSTLKGGEHEGEEADVTVTVNSVKERELPELDDDFAQMASEFDTVGELRADLRENLAKFKVQEQAVAARDQVADFFITKTKLEIPAEAVENEVTRIMENNAEAKEDEVREEVEKQMKRHIILDRLADEKEVQLDPNELYSSIFEMAKMYGVEPMQLIQDQAQVAAMGQDLRRNKALVAVLRDLEVKDKAGNVVDLSEFLKETSDATQVTEEAEEAE